MQEIGIQTPAKGRDPSPRSRKSGLKTLEYTMSQEEEGSPSPVEEADGEITEDKVCSFLKDHRSFLENFVMEEVELETIERWIIRRTQRDKNKGNQNKDDLPEDTEKEQDLSFGAGDEPDVLNNASDNSSENGVDLRKITRKTSLSRWKFCVHADKSKMLKDMTETLQTKPNKLHILWELSQCIASAINADGANLYLTNQSKNGLEMYIEDPRGPKEGFDRINIEEGSYVCAFVASTRSTIRVSGDVTEDSRFPKGCPFQNEDKHHILAMPVSQNDGELAGVLELYRKETSDEFHEEDEEIVNSYLVWGGIALHYSELYHSMTKQRELNEFLLSVVQSIFKDMVSMDDLIKTIMRYAQELVSADRASLFLVDNKNKEIYARIFDIGSDSVTENLETAKEIRFPVGKGIAGIVAKEGQGLNIENAYSDPRFNRDVDQKTGYVTKSILCMPIFIRGSIIGVVQMVNKKNGKFTKHDEESFDMFAVYCGLALHHAKLYDKIRRSEQKYKVALEIMSYHANCAEDDFSVISSEEIPETIPEVDSFYFSPLNLDELDKVRNTIFMFVDLFGLGRFDKDCLIRFCLTVRKNYRRVPYHNWTHGFSVANSMYAIIKHDPQVFRPLECLSLFIGALCHDLDHRGKNNKFLLDTDSPLAAIYTTSTLEHHHFNQTVTILQQEGHNIFSKLRSSDYKQVLSNIKHCILATDLAVFFPNKAKLTTLVEQGSFSWGDPEHRLMLEAVTMTASDLCASAKPWDVQAETVKVIFEEFYEQGDAEKAAGREPIPMMNRDKPQEQPSSQVGFLSGICIPCYGLIAKLIPSSAQLLDGCQKNLERWKELEEEVKQEEVEEEENVDKANEKEILQNISSNEETSDKGKCQQKTPPGPKLGFKKAPDIKDQRKVKRDLKSKQKDEATKPKTSTTKSIAKKSETQQHSVRRKDASGD